MYKNLKSSLKLLLILVLVVTVLFIINSCGAKNKKVTLRVAWWGNPTRDERTLKVIEMYMQENPNVTIEPETTGWSGYWDKIATQATAKNLPDVMQHDYAYLLQYVSKDLMQDLTSYVKSKKLNLENVPDSFLSGGMVDKKIYGISLGTNAVCMVYDPIILQKAGVEMPKPDWTWEDFEKIATEIFKKTKVQTLPFFAVDPKVGFDNWIRQTGKSFFNPDGTSLGFDDNSSLTEYFSLQLDLLKAGVLVKPAVAFETANMEEDQFAKGNSWVQYVWSNQVVATLKAANKSEGGINLLPKIKNSSRPGTYLKPSMFFAVTKDSTKKDEAVRFINYFLNNIEANKVLLAERGVPIISAVRDSIKTMVDPVAQQVFDYIKLVGDNSSPIDPPDPVGTGEVLKLFKTIDQEVLFGKTSPEDAAANFIKQANEILAKNK